MRTLFLRIFLWFWLAMAVVAVLLVISSPFFTRTHPRLDGWQKGSEDWIRSRVENITADITTQGWDPDPSPHSRRRGRRNSSPVFIFDSEARRVFGPRPDPRIEKLASRVLEEDEELIERSGAWFFIGRPLVDPRGSRYVVAAAFLRPPRLVDLLEPRTLAPRLLALALVAGLLCFPLARYLASPVGALRTTTHRLAEGVLSARVAPRVSRRRDEIGDLARDFDTMAERIETLVSSQRRLLRDVSHELRSPLTRLGLALELARAAEPSKATQYLNRVEHESERLNELIRQLLTLTRFDDETAELDTEPFDLVQLLEDVVSDADFEAKAKDCAVGLSTQGEGVVVGNSQLLASAMDNIIRNAVRHTAEGTQVEVTLTCVAVDSHDKAKATVRVRDHGPGVASEHLDQIFTPFFRVEDARDRGTGGAGLGLAIAAHAITAHGGTVVAANCNEGGLEISVDLPLARTS
ncbi:MAG: HAMP domain-containing protein [bacterium]|nr:HAMP domain-containing protein [bacterium]